jgi:hypothetical protein
MRARYSWSMSRWPCFALLLLGCSMRAAPAGGTKHVAAAPSLEPVNDAGLGSTSFVLAGGNVFGVGQRNLRIDAGRVVAVGVSVKPGDRVRRRCARERGNIAILARSRA